MRRVLGLACLCWLAGCGGPGTGSDAGTSDDAAIVDGHAVDAPAIDAAGIDAAALDAAALDAAALDAAAHDASLVDLACLGPSRALTISHGLPFVDVAVGAPGAASRGAFLVDLATTASAIDLAAFTSPPAARGCDAGLLGQRCTFDDLDFFGPWGAVTLVTEDLSGLGGLREAGILGTDFLSVSAITLDYGAAVVRSSPAAAFCDDATLAAAGFVPLSTAGFYANDLGSLRPMHDVDASAPAGASVPNVPTVGVYVAGERAFAQLDTGFDDSLVPGSIEINQAFYDAIVGADVGALVRDPGRDLTLTTCVGIAEPVEAYTLADGRVLELITAGVTTPTLAGLHVYVKRTPDAARACGGIGTWTTAAAQLDASTFVRLGVVIADPFSSRVWVRPPSP